MNFSLEFRLVFISFFFLLAGCKNQSKSTTSIPADAQDTSALNADYFPINDFILGQIAEVKKANVNPLQIVNDGFKKDSTWLQINQIDSAFSAFTTTTVDTNTVKQYYRQTTFQDQTINKFTFTYTPTSLLPEDAVIRSWNVYVSPQTNMVTSIYMHKQLPGKGKQFLTWNADSNCTIQTLKDDLLISETSIIWNF